MRQSHLFNSTPSKSSSRIRQGRPPIYDEAVKKALITTWNVVNQICAKRLVPFLPELVSVLERHGHLSLPTDVKTRLLSISISTADRLIKGERLQQGKGMSTTKPGALLKKQIQVRTFADWDDVTPGFMEGDLVAHCGETVSGSFLNTLVLTDIVSGWTECLPLLCKSAANVISGITITQSVLPFTLLGIDTDNGSEFINYELLNFCKAQKITFTRSRAYKKNDQAHVEEKNGSIVRRLVGYDRYEGLDAWHVLVDLYAVLRLYVNYFQPSLKLLSKVRNGGRTTKKYDKAQTPCQRLLSSKNISQECKEKLSVQYESLDPVNLLERLKKCQEKFWKYAWSVEKNDYKAPKVSLPTNPQNCSQQESTKEKRINNFETEDQGGLLNQKYRRTRKPRKLITPRTWRTRKDPFERVWDNMRLQLELSPHLTSKSLLDGLMQQHPAEFNYKYLRTLQRRVAEWRAENVNQLNKKRISIMPQKDDTHQYLSLVLGEENSLPSKLTV